MGECSWAQVKEQLVDTDRKSCSGNNFWKCFMDLEKDHLKLFLALSQTSAASSHLFLCATCCDCSLGSFSEPAFSSSYHPLCFLYESFQDGLNSPFIRIVGSISSSPDLPFNTIFTCQTYSLFLALTPLGGLKLCMFPKHCSSIILTKRDVWAKWHDKIKGCLFFGFFFCMCECRDTLLLD